MLFEDRGRIILPSSTDKRRKKVSITLEDDIVKRVVAYQKSAGLLSFSAALEEMLWRHTMEEEEKAYHLSLSTEEQAEQDAWNKFATDQFFNVTREG